MAIPCPELDDSEKLFLSREMSENDGIERGRNQAIRQGTSSREKQARGDKVRTLAGTFLHRQFYSPSTVVNGLARETRIRVYVPPPSSDLS